jgi:hypothetical protein
MPTVFPGVLMAVTDLDPARARRDHLVLRPRPPRLPPAGLPAGPAAGLPADLSPDAAGRAAVSFRDPHNVEWIFLQ